MTPAWNHVSEIDYPGNKRREPHRKLQSRGAPHAARDNGRRFLAVSGNTPITESPQTIADQQTDINREHVPWMHAFAND